MSDSNTVDVLPVHEIDERRLTEYMNEQIDGFSGPMRLSQFMGGQSNPTYLIETDSKRFVLRKKPPGVLLPSAHLVEREYRIMAALRDSDVPVPNVHCLCENSAIIGTPFYVMEWLPGRVFSDPALSGLDGNEREQIYDAMSRTLAALHNVNWASAGLSDFGKHGDYVARQVRLWTKQYRATETEPNQAMENLIAWLPENIPNNDEVTIAHGDFRLENLIFDPIEAKVLGLLDWELSTLGHPLADLAFNCMVFHMPHGTPGVNGLSDCDLQALNIPDEQSYVQKYSKLSERDAGKDWKFFRSFAMFRSASILQGVYARALNKSASSENALIVGKVSRPLSAKAWELIERG